LRNVAESVRFWELSPVDGAGSEYDSLITQGPSGSSWQLLANPGAQYVAYFWGSPSTDDAAIDLLPGTYSYEWVDVRDASVCASGTVAGGGTTTIPAPAIEDWSGDAGLALVLRAGS